MQQVVDPDALARLSKVFVRFADSNEGTRTAAVNTFLAVCDSERIDVRDLSLSLVGSEQELEKRWSEYKAIMLQAYPGLDKVHALLDQLRADNRRLKDAIRDSRKAEQLAAKLDDAEAKVTGLREQVRKLKDDRPLIAYLKHALGVVAAPAFTAPMEEAEMAMILEDKGIEYDRFCQDVRYGGGNIMPWLRVLVRALRPDAPVWRMRRRGDV